MFPGYDVKSSFMDGMPSTITAPPCRKSSWRFGGIGIAFTMTTIGVRILHFLPQDDLAELEAATSATD
jgi:hypothetical protein